MADVLLRKELWNPAESQGEDGVPCGAATPTLAPGCSGKTARMSTAFYRLCLRRRSAGAGDAPQGPTG